MRFKNFINEFKGIGGSEVKSANPIPAENIENKKFFAPELKRSGKSTVKSMTDNLGSVTKAPTPTGETGTLKRPSSKVDFNPPCKTTHVKF